MAEGERQIKAASEGLQSDSAAMEALGFLLEFLFVRPRLRDDLLQPPLFDRTDFAEHVGQQLDAPSAQWTPAQRAGLQWLVSYCDARLKLD